MLDGRGGGDTFSPGDVHSLPRLTVLDPSLGPSTQDAWALLPRMGSALKQLKLTFQKSPGHTTLENQSQHSSDTAPAHSRTRGFHADTVPCHALTAGQKGNNRHTYDHHKGKKEDM